MADSLLFGSSSIYRQWVPSQPPGERGAKRGGDLCGADALSVARNGFIFFLSSLPFGFMNVLRDINSLVAKMNIKEKTATAGKGLKRKTERKLTAHTTNTIYSHVFKNVMFDID